MKVYARCRTIHDEHAGRIPYNRNIAIAIEGFHEMGFEIHFYDRVDEIYDIYEKGDIVLDGIQQVDYCLNKFGFKFPQIEYPECLEKYLGRKIWKDTTNSIANDEKKWSAGNFIKPLKEKAFTGKIISNLGDLIGCGSCYENYEVFVSEPLDIVYEVRGTVYYDQLVDLRPYRGNWEYMNKLDTSIIKQAMKDWIKWKDRPSSCTLDWGIIRVKKDSASEIVASEEYTYKTILIEANSGCCYGPYSTNAINYAKMISAAISKVSETNDECYYGPILEL